MRRVAILQQVQNPPRCEPVEDLGPALEKWLSKKRQNEMFTDRNGRPCQAFDDTLVAAMFRLMPKRLEGSVMFANEYEGFQELYDRLLAYSSKKQSITMSKSKKTTRKDDPMDVDALSKGSGKGKSKGKGKKVKGQNHMSNAECWNCGKSGHCEKDCRQKWTQDMWWSRGKDKSKARGYEHADGWTWKGDEQSDGWWKTTDWQRGTGSEWWTTASDWTPWESEEAVDGIEFNCIEECCSENPRRGEKQKMSESDGRGRGAPAPKPSPTPNPTRSPSEDSGIATSEPSGMSETSASDTSETSLTSRVEAQEWNWRAKTYCDKLDKSQRMRCQLVNVEQKAPKRVSWCTSVEEGHNVEASEMMQLF